MLLLTRGADEAIVGTELTYREALYLCLPAVRVHAERRTTYPSPYGYR